MFAIVGYSVFSAFFSVGQHLCAENIVFHKNAAHGPSVARDISGTVGHSVLSSSQKSFHGLFVFMKLKLSIQIPVFKSSSLILSKDNTTLIFIY